MKNHLKTALFVALVPGSLTILVPRLMLMGARPMPFEAGFASFLGIPLVILGAAALLWAAGDFAGLGKGTPAPFDPPKALVIGGPFTFVRNPMYVGVLTVLAGEGLHYGSGKVLLFGAALLVLFHLRVVFHEEPHLRRRFGVSYETYCRATPRWWPRFPRP